MACYEKNWDSMIERWCFYHKTELQTLRNLTTNRMERFFHTLKAAIRGGGRKRSQNAAWGEHLRVDDPIQLYHKHRKIPGLHEHPKSEFNLVRPLQAK